MGTQKRWRGDGGKDKEIEGCGEERNEMVDGEGTVENRKY